MIKAILFDMDGVLVDSTSAMEIIYKKAFEGYPAKIDSSITKYMGIGSNKIIEIYCKRFNIPYSEELAKKIDEKKQKANIEVADQLKILPGAIELLGFLKGKYKLAVASSNAGKVLDAYLEKKNLDKYFDAVVSLDDASEAKPDPAIFLKAAEKLGVDVQECVVIEDAVFGVEAAKKAGMICIGVTTGVYNQEELKNADLVISSLKEIKLIIEYLSDL